jgi:hypothetical protein
LADQALITVTGRARAHAHGTCADLVTSSSKRCGLFGHGYAWTIGQGPHGTVTVTIYAETGSSWREVLASSPRDPAYEAAVVPFSTQNGDPAVAIWQVTSGDGSYEDVSVVQDGRIAYEQGGSIEAIKPQDDGLRIWSGVYRGTDPVCCPSGHTATLLVRGTSAWSTQDTQAVPANLIPKMPVG